jgi:hypothetical protein
MNNTSTLKQLLLPYDIGHSKIHVGPKYDGGYVLSKELLDTTDAIYSLGIGGECGFDFELAELGYPIYMYESSHSAPPMAHKNFFYKQMVANSTSIKTEIEQNNHTGKRLLLAMDIEGGEYELLANIEDSVLFQFKQLTFEVHNVLYNSKIIPILERLNNNYVLIHIHTNNNCIRPGAFSSGVIDGVPNVIELTYIHRDEYTQPPVVWTCSSPIENLDYKNQLDLPDVELNWWMNS